MKKSLLTILSLAFLAVISCSDMPASNYYLGKNDTIKLRNYSLAWEGYDQKEEKLWLKFINAEQAAPLGGLLVRGLYYHPPYAGTRISPIKADSNHAELDIQER